MLFIHQRISLGLALGILNPRIVPAHRVGFCLGYKVQASEKEEKQYISISGGNERPDIGPDLNGSK